MPITKIKSKEHLRKMKECLNCTTQHICHPKEPNPTCSRMSLLNISTTQPMVENRTSEAKICLSPQTRFNIVFFLQRNYSINIEVFHVFLLRYLTSQSLWKFIKRIITLTIFLLKLCHLIPCCPGDLVWCLLIIHKYVEKVLWRLLTLLK